MERELTKSMEKHLEWIRSAYENRENKITKIYENGIKNTYQTTIQEKEDGTTFIITGDIPAMWLRDSATQVRPLLLFVKEDPYIRRLVAGVIRKQLEQIGIDPYANAFNDGPTGAGHQDDDTQMKPDIWERKYEIDSLCYPIQLLYFYRNITGDTSLLDVNFLEVCHKIIEVFKCEQHHHERSTYSFRRDEDEEERIIYETLPNDGRGIDVAYTGMTWCAFRPSDDACQQGYLVPANMFAVVILDYMCRLLAEMDGQKDFIDEIKKLRQEIEKGIQTYGIIETEAFGPVYAYEVDGYGNYLLMDDANVPSLMAIPYFGYRDTWDPIYQNTRRMLLSHENPYYYEGKVAKGIGSPHTPEDYIWPIALAIQGLTSESDEEKQEILDMLVAMDADILLMHEGVHKDDATIYTRPWFSWANAMFSEFVMSLHGKWIEGSPLDQKKS